MRKRTSAPLIALLSIALLASSAVSGPKRSEDDQGEDHGGHGHKTFSRERGELYCPVRALVYGGLIIPAGRCYVISVFRDRRGEFLAFVPEDEHIPPGQHVRLDTPAGPKLKGRMFLVPIRATAVVVPVDAVTLVPVRIEDYGPRLAIVLVGSAAPNVTVVFNVHL
jgi:hypothetical protein